MQISIIDVRTEGLDRPGGGKRGGKDEASAESAFAAFFATQLDAQRQPEAKTAAKTEADSVSEMDSTDDAKATSKAQTKTKHHAESGATANAEETAAAGAAPKPEQSADGEQTTATPQAAEAPIPPQSAEGGQVEAAAIAVLQPRHAASSAKFSVVSKDGNAATVKLNVSAAQPLASEYAKAVEVPLVPSTPSALPAPQTEVTETAPAAVTSLAPPIQAGIARVEVDPELKVTPSKSDAATAAEEPAKADAIELPADAPETAMDDSGEQKEQGTGDETARTFTGPAAKLPVSKLQSHAVTPEATPVQTVDNSVSAEPNISEPRATDSAENVQVTPQDNMAGDAIESIAADPENQKADVQVVRNVTQVVSQDGTIVATRSTEVRSEHAQAAGQRETVVVERTTIQALPEQALRSARFLLNNAEQTMRIRLMPESLGEVRLEVVAAKGDVTVKLASANAAVREILQTHAPGLQHAIAQDNTGNVRVTVTADVGSGAWLSSNANRNNGQQDPNAQAQANQRSATPSLYRDANPATTATPRREAAHTGNLNVYV